VKSQLESSPFPPSSIEAGEGSLCIFAGEWSFLDLEPRGRGDISVGVSVKASDGGVSISGVKAFEERALGGRAGSDLSRTIGVEPLAACCLCLDFLRLRAIRDSWHCMQNMP
jgi:hypothetical protein